MPDLFDNTPQHLINVLPQDGILNYYGSIFNIQDSKHYFDLLMSSVDWRNDAAMVFGKLITTKRKTGWYGDKDFSYTYSGIERKALPWTKELLQLKSKVESISNETFNSCLLNLYHDGNEGVSWHSDDEKMLKKHGAVASLSFGAERIFQFKHKKLLLKTSIQLEQGSLLIMKGAIQDFWLHQIPKTSKVKTPRINLTFRTIILP